MTDRTISLLVTLDKEYRTDDAESIENAIKMIKGVLEVKVTVYDSEAFMNKIAMKNQLKREVWETIWKAMDTL